MRAEVESAAGFLSSLLKARSGDDQKAQEFREKLEQAMFDHYVSHWHIATPHKGSGYRCIRIHNKVIDPVLLKAGYQCGLNRSQLGNYLPHEITLWVDPSEVAYRIGEEGSIGLLLGDDTSSDNSEPSDDSSSDSDSITMSPPPYASTPTKYQPVSSCGSEYVVRPNVCNYQGRGSPAQTYGYNNIYQEVVMG